MEVMSKESIFAVEILIAHLQIFSQIYSLQKLSLGTEKFFNKTLVSIKQM